MMTTEIKSNIHLPDRIVWLQIILFSILYMVWILPETLFIRNFCLTVGAAASLYQISQYRPPITKSVAMPAWLLLGLFVWVSFHLLFLSVNFNLQFQEFTSIWKRVLLGTIFGLGLGVGLAQVNLYKKNHYWQIFYLGLISPTLIYILKYLLVHYGNLWGIQTPEFLNLYYEPNTYYIAKTSYVCFCLPALAVALSQILQIIEKNEYGNWKSLAYLITMPAVLFVFYSENIKNGFIYSGLLIAVFIYFILVKNFKKHWVAKTALIGFIVLLGSLFLPNHIQKNESWRTIVADAKIAVDTNNHENWKFLEPKELPQNELGKVVSGTNYQRIAWGKIGLSLVPENPFGYGMLEESFGRLAKKKWPESTLRQSHSGWLDLILGIGIPGFLLVFGALIGSIFFLNRLILKKQANQWASAFSWVLLASAIMWFTTEISQKVFFDSLIFWIALSSGFALNSTAILKRSRPQLPAIGTL